MQENWTLAPALTPTYCDRPVRIYRDSSGGLWFLLTDVFRAMERHNPAKLRKRLRGADDITKVRAWIVNTVNHQDSGYRLVQAVNQRGMRMMLDISAQLASIGMLRWSNLIAERHSGAPQ